MTIVVQSGVLRSNAWTPANLGTDLLAWYKSSTNGVVTTLFTDAGTTLATDTQLVQQWNDSSGNNYHLTATGSDRPTLFTGSFGGGGMFFFNDDRMFSVTDAVAIGAIATVSVFAVIWRYLDTQGTAAGYMATGRTDCSTATNSAAFIKAESASVFGARRNSSFFSKGTINDQTTYRLASIFDGVNHTFYINNTAQTAVANTDGFATPGTICLGDDGPGTGVFFNGYIVEIFYVKLAADSTLRNNVHSYFGTKYGL